MSLLDAGLLLFLVAVPWLMSVRRFGRWLIGRGTHRVEHPPEEQRQLNPLGEERLMRELLFTIDGLLDGERMLVSFDPTVGSFGRFTCPVGQYDIARRERRGWHMQLKDSRTGEQSCEFRPRLLRRGGKLIGAEGTAKLGGRPIRPSHWRFTAQGARIEATTHPVLSAERHIPGRLEVRLQGGDWVGAPPISLPTLAFGCWLIVQWEIETPPDAGPTW